jgi:putative MATE family efflux protein
MEEKNNKDKMLGTERIGKLLTKLSVPAIVGMIVNALYNVVDTIFIGRGVGTMGIGGLTIAFPVQMFIMAVAMLIGIGAASVISRGLGAGERDRANRSAGNTLSVSIIFGVIVMAAGYLLMKPLLRILGATEEIMPYARDYLSVIFLGAPFITFAAASNNVVRAEGRAAVAMLTMVIGTGLNILLDPIFIFGLGLGVKGAAIATVISQFVSFTFLLLFFLSGRSSLKIKLKYLRPNWHVLGEMLKLGLPIFVRQFGVSIFAVIVNNSLRAYGSGLHIAAFGVVNRLLMFMLMPLMGLSQGFQPIAGYNYGARDYGRVREVVKVSIIVSTLIAAVFFVIVMLFPRPLLRIFSEDALLIREGIRVLRTVSIAVPLIGLQLIGATYFLALGKAIPSLLLGMSRQILFLIPLVLLLPLAFGLNGIWIAFPAADFLATAVTVIWFGVDIQRLRLGKAAAAGKRKAPEAT